MNRKFLLAMMLASGMAFAQSSGSAGSSQTPDQQQPSAQQPSSQTPDQQQPPSQTPEQQQPATPPSGEQSTQTPGTETSAGQPTSMTGCLKQAGGNWTLAAENGQTINLTGDSSMLKPNDGHQVQVQGTQASDGSFQVTAVNSVSDSCTNQQASTG
ncbi:MAG TPA: hypothetical protein VLT16_13535, partial [Candidatus Limnocylindrales bacterium]|nr:hypothetical protein [Candidatus Limnocylindrales bacterium]